MHMFSLALVLTGLTLLSLSMDRHHQQLLTGKPSPARRRAFGLAAWLVLLTSAALCVTASGWSIGLTWWLGCVAVAAAALALMLSYRPRSALFAATLAPAIGAACLVLIP